jgi:ribosomal-protein-alanine N-acetyltransferase
MPGTARIPKQAMPLTADGFRVSIASEADPEGNRSMATTRSARQEDAAAVAAIGMRAWESAVAGWMDIALLRANAERAFAVFAVRSYVSIDIADNGGQAVGWAARENFDNRITDLWIDPPWQRQGFGRLLLDKLEADIQAQGYDTATIETHAQNGTAIACLRHLGYSIHWMTAAWSPQLDRDVDTVGLVKRFEAAPQPPAYAEF